MTNLNRTNLTPAPWPVQVGQLGVLLTPPHKGFAVEVVEVTGERASVRFLDADTADKGFSRPLFSVLPTGKTADSLSERYEPTPLSLDAALDEERSLPDFDALKKGKKAGSGGTRGPGRSPKTPKQLNEGQKEQLKRLVMRQLEEMEGDEE